jgi:hypothetical protein
VTLQRAYYQCIRGEEEAQQAVCSHGQAPFDETWNLSGKRSSPGVQKLLGKLVARMTLTESVETFRDILPLPLTERQVLNVVQPVGEALCRKEEAQVTTLFEHAAHKQTQPSEQQSTLGSPSGACISRPMG